MRRRIIGTALSAAIALGGGTACSAEQQATPAAEWVNPTAEQPHGNANGTQKVLDIGNLASRQVAKPVIAELNTAVRVTMTEPVDSQYVSDKSASGVVIKGGILTAGHLFNGQINGNNKDCTDLAVHSKQFINGTQVKSGYTHVEAIQTSGGDDDQATSHSYDMALIPTDGQPTKNVATMTKKNEDMPVGTRLTFVNYQPSGSGASRSPELDGKPGQPAIFEGFVLQDKRGDQDQIAVLTGPGHSYGMIHDNIGRKGMSGGEVLSDDGVVRGIVSAATGQGGSNPTIEQIESDFDVDIVNAPDTGDRGQIVWVQSVNEKLVASLANDPSTESVTCK